MFLLKDVAQVRQVVGQTVLLLKALVQGLATALIVIALLVVFLLLIQSVILVIADVTETMLVPLLVNRVSLVTAPLVILHFARLVIPAHFVILIVIVVVMVLVILR